MTTQYNVYKKRNYGPANFINKFKAGVAKQNRFRVEFFLPRGVTANPQMLGINPTSLTGAIQQQQSKFNRDESINIMCHTAQLPSRKLDMIEYTHLPNLPFKTSIEPIDFAFYTDSNYSTREYWDIWLNTIYNFKSKTLNYYNEYISDVKIHTINAAGDRPYTVTLYEAFPISIAASDLAYGNTDLQTITVSMSYRYWTANDTKSIA